MKENVRRALYRALKATSFIMVLKGAVGGSVVALALVGVTVPALSDYFGVHAANLATQGVAGVLGAVLGGFAALRA
jgi:hypothetical protein